MARTVSAIRQPWVREPGRLAHADALAVAVALDMADYWTPTAENYFGRETKARIIEAVREAAPDRYTERLADLNKTDLARQAEGLLAEKTWLPACLRTASSQTVFVGWMLGMANGPMRAYTSFGTP